MTSPLTPLRSLALLPLVAAGCATSPAYRAPAPQFSGSATTIVSLVAGQRALGSEFDPADEPYVLGIDVAVQEDYDILGMEFGYQCASDSGSKSTSGVGSLSADSFVHELYMGGRWTFDPWDGALRPLVGVGGAFVCGSYEIDGAGGSSEEDGMALGVYAHAGIAWHVGERAVIGLDYRKLFSTSVSLQDDATFGYDQLALAFGYSF